MSELLIPADVELAAITELSSGYPANGFSGLTVAAKTVGTKIPTATPRPADWVRVLAAGGPQVDLVADSMTLVLEGWSTSEGRAQQIAAFGIAILQAAGRDGFVGGVPCRRVDVAALPQKLPDPTVTTHARFTAMISVVLRRATV